MSANYGHPRSDRLTEVADQSERISQHIDLVVAVDISHPPCRLHDHWVRGKSAQVANQAESVTQNIDCPIQIQITRKGHVNGSLQEIIVDGVEASQSTQASGHTPFRAQGWQRSRTLVPRMFVETEKKRSKKCHRLTDSVKK